VVNIYVGNLSFKSNEGELKALFEQHGEVKGVKVVTDRETGRSRGFAFVEMNDAEGKAAIAALNGTEFDGRQIVVNEARPRRDDRRGGGGQRRERDNNRSY
jgi:RNA recognition motif-containing protein